ncbi:hypothetical protein [Arenimonas caeni]|uniref:Uncharacterized protein n=1 Tax=Arenimonas caeni TaxID=2058085 RepID=A0A2P6M6U2_9GAMM|nr:hypothetical protein [Arenimonas caeni]PRH81717.1 hypothetical protein C6N40_10845 [Arenimonas caeni]
MGNAAASRLRGFGLLAAAATALLAGCQPVRPEAACLVDGPEALLPAKVLDVRPGMTREALERLMGEPDYSPAEGQYYFSTGGDCPLGIDGHEAPCGLVASFGPEEDADGARLPGRLESCWWGAIGE